MRQQQLEKFAKIVRHLNVNKNHSIDMGFIKHIKRHFDQNEELLTPQESFLDVIILKLGIEDETEVRPRLKGLAQVETKGNRRK